MTSAREKVHYCELCEDVFVVGPSLLNDDEFGWIHNASPDLSPSQWHTAKRTQLIYVGDLGLPFDFSNLTIPSTNTPLPPAIRKDRFLDDIG